MNYPFEFPRRKRLRLRHFNYSKAGFYYITINVDHHQCMFGKIDNAQMIRNAIGDIANKYLVEIPNHFSHVEINEFVVMPNHVHFIIKLSKPIEKGALTAISGNKFGPLNKGSLQVIVNQYKGAVKKWCNENNHPDFKWQSRYYDIVIKNAAHHAKIIDYILTNPANWEKEKSHG